MPSNKFLSNDTVGYRFEEVTKEFLFANESSAHGNSATLVPVFIAPRAGRVVNAYIGVAVPALSASGFVSGTVDAQVRINSATVLSTLPSIAMAGSAGQAVRKNTLTSALGITSAVINPGSASFSAGAMISIDYNARSTGSAAAGAAGTGLYVAVTVRYEAI